MTIAAEELNKEAEKSGFKGFRLEDLVRTESSVFLYLDEKDSENKIEFKLRPVGLADEVWMKKKWGNSLSKIFSDINVAELSKLIFHQLTDEDKKKVPGIKRVEMDDDGFEHEVIIPSWHRIQNGIRGISHQLEVYQSLLELIGLSRPVLDKLTKEEEKAIEKKRQEADLTIPTGGKSSINSPVSTDGPSPKSEE